MSNALESEANAGTTEVRPAHQFDELALAEWMGANIANFEGPMKVEQFKGGQSNPTYRLHTPRRDYVLRRKPPGTLLTGAHDVLREARVMRALAPTNIPVPAVEGICDDASVVGTSFFIMELVEGRIFWDATFPDLSRSSRAACFDAMNSAIAALHMLDPAATGLADHGRPGNYFERQIARWTRQYREDEKAGRDPDMDALVEWLPQAIPRGDERSALVHGDFRCDNLIFHPTETRISAILDWELSTLGHPLGDFAYHAIMYRMPSDILAGLVGADLDALGIPSEGEYIDAYCRRTNRQSLPDYDFYIAFNFFRLAAIFHGIKGRVIRGTASSAHAKKRAEAFPRLAALARTAMDACK